MSPFGNSLLAVLLLVMAVVVSAQRPASLTLEDFASQMTQIDIQSMLLNNTQQLNETVLSQLIESLGIGSVLNSPSSNVGYVPTTDEWRTMQKAIYQLSTTLGNKIPLLYGLDSVHGANYIFNATLFPQQIGVAATFNTTVAYQAGTVTGRETRYVGIPWVFSPILGLAVQPSWARVFETFGEDPKLVGDMGVNIIQGLQQPPPPEMNLPAGVNYTVAACMKHYIGYTNVRTGRDRTPVFLPMNILLQYFAPPFQRAIDEAGVLSVMENYIELNGRPVVASEMILKHLLRHEMGFGGMLVTDYNEIFNLADFHMAAATYVDAIEMSLNATTIDMAMVGNWAQFPAVSATIMQLVEQEKLDPGRVQESGERVLALKEQLGLFQGSPVPEPTGCVFACPEHRQAALEAAQQSIVLLQNDGILPLSPETLANSSIAVVGQACNSVPLMAGGWTIRWQGTSNKSAYPYGSTVYEELVSRFPGALVTFHEGCNVTEDSTCDPQALQDAVAAAAAAAVTIVCVGERHYAEKPGDIYDLTLPGQQIPMVRSIAARNPNVVLVLVEGRPRILQDLPDQARAVLNAMLPGPAGGAALVDVMTGVVNPSGRQPITYPQSLNNAPIQYWRKYSANTSGDYTVQWPFGHGLSYTTFSYSNLAVAFNPAAGTFDATVTVTNTGSRDGATVVLLYSTQVPRPITPEVQQLRAFEKVFLVAGASAEVKLSFPFVDVSYYDEYNCRKLQKGSFLFTVDTLAASASFPVNWVYTCTSWGKLWQEHTGAAAVPHTGAPVSAPTQPRSTTSEYVISSVVCFGAGIAGAVIIISYLRRRQGDSGTKEQLLEPSGV